MLIAAGNGPAEGWRFGVLQTLDGYASTKRRGGVQLASHVFTEPPAPTGSKVASHDERMRFDGVTSILYVTDERTGHAIDRHIEQRVFVDDRPRFMVLPVLDVWGRVRDDLWPYTTPRFTSAAADVPHETPPPVSGLF